MRDATFDGDQRAAKQAGQQRRFAFHVRQLASDLLRSCLFHRMKQFTPCTYTFSVAGLHSK